MAYVVSAAKASSIRIACKANFIHEDTLITASSNIVSVYQPNSLVAALEITCHGRIASITAFRPSSEASDHLILTTDDHKYFTLAYKNGQVITGVCGDLHTDGLSTPDCGHKVIVNQDFIIMYVYSGIVTVFPLNVKNPRKRPAEVKLIGDPVQLRLHEVKVHEIAMLQGAFAVLYRDQQLVTQLRTYEIASRKGEYELRPGPVSMHKLEQGTNMIISEEDTICCIGESTIYVKSSTTAQAEFPLSVPTLFNSKCKVMDGWLLGDDYGLIYHITCTGKPEIRILSSSVSIPAVLVAIRDQIFLGSHYGDSQLLSKSLEVIDTKTNLGPIQDIIVEAQEGPSNLITASGAYKDGSLRYVKYGVGINVATEIDMEGIRGIWGIDELSLIVISFIDSYLVLRAEEEFSQVDAGEGAVIYACYSDGLVMVQRDRIHWPNASIDIETVVAKHYQSKLFAAGNVLTVFEGGQKVKESPMDNISAIEISEERVILGLWSCEVIIFDHNLSKLDSIRLDAVPSSLVLVTFDSPSLLIGLQDGSLLTRSIGLAIGKSSILGTTAVALHAVGKQVFAVCDRISLIHTVRNKLVFSGVSTTCDFLCSFKESLILANASGIRIGSVDNAQKLQSKTTAIRELPRRLIRACGYLCALTMKLEVEEITGNERQRSYLRVMDSDLHYELLEGEQCQSLASIMLDEEYIVVGTSFDNEEDECTRGRIIIFGVRDTIWIHKEIEVPGSVYCIATVGDQIVAGINSFVRLFKVEDVIKETSKHRTSTFAITMAAKGNEVLVGDLMKSVTLLKIEDGLLEVARDYVPTWTTAVGFLDDIIVATESEGGLYLLSRPDSLPEGNHRLSRVGTYNVGEMINKIVPGVITQSEDCIVKPHALFGTVDGGIGIIAKIQDDSVGLLMTLQNNIAHARPSVGNLSHEQYRAYKGSEPQRCVDGDLIETFLELSSAEQEAAVKGTDKTVAEVERIVEDLARLRSI